MGQMISVPELRQEYPKTWAALNLRCWAMKAQGEIYPAADGGPPVYIDEELCVFGNVLCAGIIADKTDVWFSGHGFEIVRPGADEPAKFELRGRALATRTEAMTDPAFRVLRLFKNIPAGAKWPWDATWIAVSNDAICFSRNRRVPDLHPVHDGDISVATSADMLEQTLDGIHVRTKDEIREYEAEQARGRKVAAERRARQEADAVAERQREERRRQTEESNRKAREVEAGYAREAQMRVGSTRQRAEQARLAEDQPQPDALSNTDHGRANNQSVSGGQRVLACLVVVILVLVACATMASTLLSAGGRLGSDGSTSAASVPASVVEVAEPAVSSDVLGEDALSAQTGSIGEAAADSQQATDPRALLVGRWHDIETENGPVADGSHETIVFYESGAFEASWEWSDEVAVGTWELDASSSPMVLSMSSSSLSPGMPNAWDFTIEGDQYTAARPDLGRHNVYQRY